MIDLLFRLRFIAPTAVTVALLLFAPTALLADSSKVVGGVAAYLGIVPAEIVHGDRAGTRARRRCICIRRLGPGSTM